MWLVIMNDVCQVQTTKSEIKKKELPPKLVRSAVKSERLKFQSCPNERLIESLDEPTPPSGPSCRPPGSEEKVGSKADGSMPMPDISVGVKGKWLLEAADEGLTAISDIADIVPVAGGPAGAAGSGTPAPLSITMLH